MKKFRFLLLTTTIASLGGLSYGETAWETVTEALKPLAKFGKATGIDVVARKVAHDSFLVSDVIDAAKIRLDASEKSFDPVSLMDTRLQRELGGRFLEFKEAAPLPSIGAMAGPLIVGKTVQTAVSFIPGVGAVSDQIGRGVGKGVQLFFRNRLEIDQNYYKILASLKILTLSKIEAMTQEISKEFMRTYESTINGLSHQQTKDIVRYATFSILDHIDEALKQSTEALVNGEMTLQDVTQTIIAGLPHRFLNIDHIFPTFQTTVWKIQKVFRRTSGFGAQTVGDILTTPVVQYKGHHYWDLSKLDQTRAENKKKRGRLKTKRSQNVLAVRSLPNSYTFSTENFKPLTAQEETGLAQAMTPLQRKLILQRKESWHPQ